jgi:hypothetical protein
VWTSEGLTRHSGRKPSSVRSTKAFWGDRLVLRRLTQRRTERKAAQLVSARTRRLLIRWLRRTAAHANRAHADQRRDLLLHNRVAAVRIELLEIAALLEHRQHVDQVCVKVLKDLLANGCDSPLYNPDVHISELHATLYYVRSWLRATPETSSHGQTAARDGEAETESDAQPPRFLKGRPGVHPPATWTNRGG